MNYQALFSAKRKLLTLFFVLIIPLLFLEGCSSSKDILSQQDMQVVHSSYQHWSVPPSGGSDVPERGTDLRVVIQEWPEEYTPKFIVYNNFKTLSATLEEQEKNKVVISGRIIRMSDMLNKRSEKVELSDRLVYSGPDGQSGYIEINRWQRGEEK